MIHAVALDQPHDLGEFRGAARKLLAAGTAPPNVAWSTGQSATLFTDPLPAGEKITPVPRSFSDLAAAVICHRTEQRFALLYEALWRIDRGERTFMDQPADPLLHRLRRMEAEVRRDQHRMTAFLRFRTVPGLDGDTYIAWYEPRHYILRRAAGFFIDRFAAMRFAILTPDLTLLWDGKAEQFAAGMQKNDAPSEDKIEDWWRCYYAAIFNPARTNARLMQSHMPKHFWQNLPEAKSIPGLIESAGATADRMIRPAPSPPDLCSGKIPHTKPPVSDAPGATDPPRSGNPGNPKRTPR